MLINFITLSMLVASSSSDINPFRCGLAPSAPTNGRELIDQENESANERIVGGTITVPYAWPWHGTLFELDIFICSGSLVDKWWFITAAHCINMYFIILLGICGIL